MVVAPTWVWGGVWSYLGGEKGAQGLAGGGGEEGDSPESMPTFLSRVLCSRPCRHRHT